MSCYSKEGVDDSSSESNYPNIPDFSQMRVNESNTPANVCKYCYKAFMECGCSKSGALGICANIAAESDFKPDLITWDGSKKSGKFGIGGGLCGLYRFGDLPALAQHAKKPSMADIELKQQVDYLISIINDRYSDIKTQSSPSDAALWWCRKYERPACVTDRWQRYGKTVTKYLNS